MTTPTVPFLRGCSARRVSSLVAGTVAATLLLAPLAMSPTATAIPATFDSGFS